MMTPSEWASLTPAERARHQERALIEYASINAGIPTEPAERLLVVADILHPIRVTKHRPPHRQSVTVR